MARPNQALPTSLAKRRQERLGHQPADEWADLQAILAEALERDVGDPTPDQPVYVAFSGGADSTLLLWAAHRRWPESIRAIHINHGLQSAAQAFEDHCVQVCKAWSVPLDVVQVAVQVRPGDSLEERARQGRYAALAQSALSRQVKAVLVAQHAHDQLETVVLALSRGAGVHGLAGMPAAWHVDGALFLRPWLGVPGDRIQRALQGMGLPFIEDPTNGDPRWTRNRIRAELLPVLLRVFPSLLQTVGRSARHCAQAARLLDAQADAFLGASPQTLPLPDLQRLEGDLMAQVLRRWLRQVSGRAPGTAQLDELMRQVRCATTRGHRIHIRVGEGWVERQRDALQFVSAPTLSRV